jgi:ribosomal protein S3
MSSRYGLTVDEALAQLMVAERIENEQERRAEFRRILNKVHSLSYHLGGEDERYGQD